MALRKMQAWHDVTAVRDDGFDVTILIRHDLYKSYSKAVRPYATRMLRSSFFDIYTEALKKGAPGLVKNLKTESDGLQHFDDRDELFPYECDTSETVTGVKYKLTYAGTPSKAKK